MNALWQELVKHWATFPIVLPLMGAVLAMLVGWYRRNIRRMMSMTSILLTVVVAIATVQHAAGGEVITYEMSGWVPPFGIALVVDRLSAAMVAMTSVLALCAGLYALYGDDERDPYFHFLFPVQLAGLNGAFLTGDLFNLFVFFEVLLIASYNLLVFGGGDERTRAGLHYVVLNLIGSGLFLIGVGTLYGLTGTLNIADMAAKGAQLGAQEATVARAGAMLLVVVFCLKSALLPLYFWLPRAYGNATAPVAALFAVMTKVGIYAILRTSSVIFADGSGPLAGITSGWLIPVALATLLIGVAGVAAAKRFQVLIGYLVILSVGTILTAVGVGGESGVAAGLYYLVHSTFITGGLFLLADFIARKRPDAHDSLGAGETALPGDTWLALLFFVAVLTVVGLPPTSGFLGKVFILEAAMESGWGAVAWTIILGGGLLSIIAMAYAGSRLFWEADDEVVDQSVPANDRILGAVLLVALTVGWTAWAGPAYDYMVDTARQTLDRDGYIEAMAPQSVDEAMTPPKKSDKGSH